MFRFAVVLLVISAAAAPADQPARLQEAFRDWVAAAGAKRAVLSIMHRGQHHSDIGLRMEADAPVELASVGKAVTALCAVSLVKAGVWTFETSSHDVLGFGLKGRSVAQLMTHSAGLGPDQTQVPMQLWLDDRQDRSLDAAQRALSRQKQSAKVGQFHYNNENYAVLGAMIAAETGRAYGEYCRQTVLVPAGAQSARLSPRTGSMGSWGGWRMSVQDYARLMHWAYGPGGYVADAAAWPRAAMGGGAYYGVGMVHRAFRGGTNYWHFGLLCFPGRLNAGAYAVRWGDAWSAVAAFDACPDWDRLIALDTALARAVFR